MSGVDHRLYNIGSTTSQHTMSVRHWFALYTKHEMVKNLNVNQSKQINKSYYIPRRDDVRHFST